MASTRKLYPKGHPKHDISPWICEYTDANGKRRRYTPKTGLKKDADAYKRKIEAELERGEHVANADTLTFEAASRLWLEECERRHTAVGSPARSTILGYHTLLRTQIRPKFGPVLMTKLKGEDVQDWLNTKSSVNPYDTMRQYRLIISQIVKFCIKTNRLKRNVLVDQQVRIPGQKKRVAIPSREQIGKLLSAMEHRAKHEQILAFLQRRAFVSLALFCGMRVGEICALQWEGLDLASDVIEIRESFSAINGLKGPKTKAGVRDVPMMPLVRASLVALKEHYGENAAGFVFMTKEGVNMRSSYDNVVWRPLLHKAGLAVPKEGYQRYGRGLFHFHALRHASVSLLISEGVNGLHISSFVGHAKVSTTLDIYGHLFPEDTKVRTSMTAATKAFPVQWAEPRPIDH